MKNKEQSNESLILDLVDALKIAENTLAFYGPDKFKVTLEQVRAALAKAKQK